MARSPTEEFLMLMRDEQVPPDSNHVASTNPKNIAAQAKLKPNLLPAAGRSPDFAYAAMRMSAAVRWP